MAYYLQDGKRVRHLTGGLGPIPPDETRPPGIVGLRRAAAAPSVVGLRRDRERHVIVGQRRLLGGGRSRPSTCLSCWGLSGGRIVDKRDPKPDELTKVDGKQVHQDCALALNAMRDAAYRDGIRLPLLGLQSGYRSSQQQTKLFAAALVKYGSKAKARKWVAPPGESAHESGCAFDLYLGEKMGTKPDQIRRLEATKAYQWLKVNAPKFGLAPYKAEPWHWECDAECKANARAKWGGLANRARSTASHAVDVVQANPVKSGLGIGAVIALAVGAFLLTRPPSRAAA